MSEIVERLTFGRIWNAEYGPGVAAAWGFRAILRGTVIDFLPDRQDLAAINDVTKRSFVTMLGDIGVMGRIRDEAYARPFGPASTEVRVITWDDAPGITVRLTTNASGGYLYGTVTYGEED